MEAQVDGRFGYFVHISNTYSDKHCSVNGYGLFDLLWHNTRRRKLFRSARRRGL